MGLRRSCEPLAEANGEKQVPPLGLKPFHIWCIGDGWSTPSGVHSCRQFLDRALAPELMFPSPQRLKPSHFRILTAPLKRCSTLYTKYENALKSSVGMTVSQGIVRCGTLQIGITSEKRTAKSEERSPTLPPQPLRRARPWRPQ